MHNVPKQVWSRVRRRQCMVHVAYPSEFPKASSEREAGGIKYTKESRPIPLSRGLNPDLVSRPTEDTREPGGNFGQDTSKR